jgi:acetyltransferase-like isoleucine patch superfamily enzyme
MRALIEKLRTALARDQDLSAPALAAKIASNAAAYAGGAVWLRGCDHVGRRPRCFGRPRVDNRGSIAVGDDFAVACTFGTVLLAAGPRGTLDVGDRVTVNYGSSIAAARGVRIGHDAMIGPYCVVADSDDPSLDDDAESLPIAIGARVWLAGRVVVRPGVRIGAGSVIAAGSVVETDIPPNAIASGAPARVLRVRDLAPPPDSHVRAAGAGGEAEEVRLAARR